MIQIVMNLKYDRYITCGDNRREENFLPKLKNYYNDNFFELIFNVFREGTFEINIRLLFPEL
jgi:hypothetical protein